MLNITPPTLPKKIIGLPREHSESDPNGLCPNGPNISGCGGIFHNFTVAGGTSTSVTNNQPIAAVVPSGTYFDLFFNRSYEDAEYS
jgi:hypothetical protein